MSKNHKRTRLGNAILLALITSAAAQAQQATPDSSDQAAALGTIIVTAEKRSEDVQKVPMSIGVIDATQIENLHATQISDFFAYLPGFTLIDGGAPGTASLGIRGVTPLSAGSTVATYIDETPMGSSGNYGLASVQVLDLLPYDFQSVELLRGPQGTLYGATALGGVLRYVTKLPDLDTASYRVGADVFDQSSSSDLGEAARLGFSAPLIPGQLAVSASYARQNSPGYTDNVQTGEKDQDHYWQDAAHATLLWKPSDDLSVKVSAIQSTSNTNSRSFTALDPISLKPIYGDLTNNNYFPEPYKVSADYYNADVNWNLGWADFLSSTSYSENKSHTGQDASLIYGAAFPLFGLPSAGLSLFTADLQLYKTTQEFRLTSKDDGPIQWLVGAFYTNENASQDQVATAQNLDYSSIVGLDPLAVVALPSTYKEYAGFGDVTFKLSDIFDVTGGLRFAHNDQTFKEITSGALTGLGTVDGASSEDVLTYSFSPRLKISQDSMVYLRIASGYQPGGPNVALPGVPPKVDSSTLTNYEFGFKTLQDSGRLMFDMAVYDIEWDKIQIGANNGTVSYLDNGGTARSRGMEFSTLYSPIAGLHLGLNGAYTNAVLTETVAAIGGANGDHLPGIPQWSGSATADYSFPLGSNWNGRVGGGLRYVGDTSSALAHTANPLPQQSYTALDLNADVSNAHWTVRLFVKNATDERVYLNLTSLANAATGVVAQVQGVPLQPRTFGVGFDYNF